MADTVVGAPRVVSKPETLSNGGKKYTIMLDNGSSLVTFSERCAEAIGGHLDTELTFEVDVPDNPNMAPKVTKVIDSNGSALWEPSQGGGGGGRQWVDTTKDENSRRAVGCAIAYLADENAALIASGKEPIGESTLITRMATLSDVCLEQMTELTKRQ
jgi:hypothetical protein